MRIFKERRGVLPTPAELPMYAAQLNLGESQVYKWFWDTKKRYEDVSLLGVNGIASNGQMLTKQQIKNALKLNNE